MSQPYILQPRKYELHKLCNVENIFRIIGSICQKVLIFIVVKIYYITSILTICPCTVHWHWYVHVLVQTSPPPSPRTFPCSQIETVHMKPQLPALPPPSPRSLLQPPFSFLSLQIWLLWVPHLNGIVHLALLGVAYFTEHNVLKVHPCCSRCQSFLPFKVCYYPIVITYHTVFIHLHWWTFVLFSHFSYCEQCCHENCVQISVWASAFSFFLVYTQQ